MESGDGAALKERIEKCCELETKIAISEEQAKEKAKKVVELSEELEALKQRCVLHLFNYLLYIYKNII